MLAIKVRPEKAEKALEFIKRKSLFDKSYKIARKEGFVFFPIKKRIKCNFSIVNIKGEKKTNMPESKEWLEKKLSKKELGLVKKSFDIVGSIAILEIPKELEKKEKIIAESFLKRKNILTVLKKAAGHIGKYRIQKMKFLAGKNTRKAVHKENGVKFIVDVEKVYFSVRLGEERKRICQQIRKNEKVLVMFSGLAPYPIVFSKKSPAKKIVGVEMNPEGHKLGLENLKLNKTKNVELYCGDVRRVLPNIKQKFERIVMPLPKTAGNFLSVALEKAKKGAIIHFYSFQKSGNLENAIKIIEKETQKKKRRFEVLKIQKVGQQSPGVYRICVDFKIF